MKIIRLSEWKPATKMNWIIWYFAASFFYLFIWGLGVSFIELALILTLVNTFVLDYIENKIIELDGLNKKLTVRLGINFLINTIICILLILLYYNARTYYPNFGLEPISFGIIYLILYKLLSKLLRR